MRIQLGFACPWDFSGHLEIPGCVQDHVTNNLDFFDPMDCGPAALGFGGQTSSTTDLCCFSDDARRAQCLVLKVDFSGIDLKAKDFCYFRRLNCLGFSIENCVLVSQYPNSRDSGVLKETVECGNFGTWLCGFLEAKCGQDYWGRSAYAICYEAARSLRRCFHSNSGLCWTHRDQANFAPTLSALENDEHVEPSKNLEKA